MPTKMQILRAVKGLSQSEVARQLGVTHTIITTVERGLIPSARIQDALGEFYGLPYDMLMQRVTEDDVRDFLRSI